MDKYILDTNVYDYLFDNTIDIEKLKVFADFYSVIVQLSEINNIKDEAKKAALLNFYSKLSLKNSSWTQVFGLMNCFGIIINPGLMIFNMMSISF